MNINGVIYKSTLKVLDTWYSNSIYTSIFSIYNNRNAYVTGGGMISGPINISGTNYYISTFNSSGTFTVIGGTMVADILVVGGGGGGANQYLIDGRAPWCSGGGGGGVQYFSSQTLQPGTYTVTVGIGGTNPYQGGPGGDSSFGSNLPISYGGGGGTIDGANDVAAGCGGSGGGVAWGRFTSVRGYGIPGQGNNGGSQGGGEGGGGGAGGVGQNGTAGKGGDGGAGLPFNISGSMVYYGGGGGGTLGGSTTSDINTSGAGGIGGGGRGLYLSGPRPDITNGVANTGGGAGGGAGIGGSGVVIVRYAIELQPAIFNNSVELTTTPSATWTRNGAYWSVTSTWGSSGTLATYGLMSSASGTTCTGWTFANGGTVLNLAVNTATWGSVYAYNGINVILLQTITNTQPSAIGSIINLNIGQSYIVSMSVMSRPTATKGGNSLSVVVNTTTPTTIYNTTTGITNTTSWATITCSAFVATSSSHSITLNGASTGTDLSVYIDNLLIV